MELSWKDLQQPARTGLMDALRAFYRRNEADINVIAFAIAFVAVCVGTLLALEGLMCLGDVLGN